MNDFDKNFHINFSPLYFAFAFMLFMLWASEANANDIEEVIVVGQQEKVVETDPATESNLISAIMPAFTYNAGGYGGATFYAERGAQTVHTAVFRNGIPANEPGGSWYNFGHDIVSGEKVKVVSGANSVVYGSGAMAGTVLIEDVITKGLTVRNILDSGIEPQFVKVSTTFLELANFKDTIASARNDNDEEDTYEQKSGKILIDAGDFKVIAKYVDYDYDYDNCYGYSLNQSNECSEVGERYNVAVRNDFITMGRNYISADYFTELDPTYSNESYRDFLRIGNQLELSKNLNIAFGVDVEKQIYNTSSWQNIEGTELVEGYNIIPGSYTEEFLDYEDGTPLPLWDGFLIPDLNNPFEVLQGNGVYTLTQVDEKYSDENAGVYFQANADFILSYNFGIRLGNDDQNALRLGIEKGQFFLNIGNSFRKANLYEKFGDGYVQGNEELEPEKGVGYEIGYGAISVFKYDFEETIEYVPGYFTDVITTTLELDAEASVNADGTFGGCVLDPDYTKPDNAPSSWPSGCVYTLVDDNNPVYTMATYTNTGAYTTQGVRYANNFGPVGLMLSYTDTEQARVPKYMGAITFEQAWNGVIFAGRYAVNIERKPGEWDFVEGEFLEDLSRLDLRVSKDWNKYNLTFKVNNALDDVVEVLPGYNNRGREVLLTLQYIW